MYKTGAEIERISCWVPVIAIHHNIQKPIIIMLIIEVVLSNCTSLMEKPIFIMLIIELVLTSFKAPLEKPILSLLPRSSTPDGEADPHNVGYMGAVAKLYLPSYKPILLMFI